MKVTTIVPSTIALLSFVDFASAQLPGVEKFPEKSRDNNVNAAGNVRPALTPDQKSVYDTITALRDLHRISDRDLPEPLQRAKLNFATSWATINAANQAPFNGTWWSSSPESLEMWNEAKTLKLQWDSFQAGKKSLVEFSYALKRIKSSNTAKAYPWVANQSETFRQQVDNLAAKLAKEGKIDTLPFSDNLAKFTEVFNAVSTFHGWTESFNYPTKDFNDFRPFLKDWSISDATKKDLQSAASQLDSMTTTIKNGPPNGMTSEQWLNNMKEAIANASKVAFDKYKLVSDESFQEMEALNNSNQKFLIGALSRLGIIVGGAVSALIGLLVIRRRANARYKPAMTHDDMVARVEKHGKH